MKKRNLLIIMCLLVVLIPIKAFGLTGSVSITCDKTELSKGEEVNCILKGNSDELISAIDAQISSDEELELSDIKLLEGFLGEADFDLSSWTEIGAETVDDFDVASFKVKATAAGSYKIYVKDAFFADSVDFDTHTVSDYNLTLTVVEGQGGSGSGGSGSGGGQTVTGVPNTKKNMESYMYIGSSIVILVTAGLAAYFLKYKKNKKEA